MLYKRLSAQKVNKILWCFCEDITATAAAKLARVNRKTLNNYYNDIREKILKEAVKETPPGGGEFELDESCFGAKRVRGKGGRGAAGKTPVFGLFKRGGKVHVNIVKNCPKEELMPVIQGKILENPVVYTDGWKACDGLILNGYEHYRVFHSGNEASAREVAHQRDRELLEFCQTAACEVQRLRLGQVCATSEGVRVPVQSSRRGFTATYYQNFQKMMV